MPVVILGSLLTGLSPARLAVSDAIVVLSLGVLIVTPRKYWSPRFGEYALRVGLPLGLLVSYGILLLLATTVSPLQWAKDAFSYASFFIVLGLLMSCMRPPNLGATFFTIVLGVGLLVASQALQVSERRSGFFNDPNLAANWLASAILVMLIVRYPQRAPLRVGVIAIAIVGMVLSGSFGSFIALAAGLAALIAIRRRLHILGQVALPILVAGLAVWLLPLLANRFLETDPAMGVDRYSASKGVRTEIWHQAWATWIARPLGSGPGGFSQSAAYTLDGTGAETHNDFLGILVDLGAIGCLLWCLALIGLYLLSEASRPVVALFAAASLTINAINFRHIWYFLALIVAYEWWSRPGGRSGTPRRLVGLRT